MNAKDFLSVILSHKMEEVTAAKLRTPENALKRAFSDKGIDFGPRRSFEGALKTPSDTGTNVIAEIKRVSPSKGDIRSDLDPAYYSGAYEKGGARAISVLTDEAFFKGSIDDLIVARNASSLPVLRKDFTISEYQIYEAEAIGADAVLLIVRILTPETLRDFLSLSHELGLSALVEVNSLTELEIAMKAGATLIGINNRDLKTFKTDLGTTIAISKELGPEHTAVAASGVSSRGDVLNILKSGVFNFLVGESLVRADDPVKHLKFLIGA